MIINLIRIPDDIRICRQVANFALTFGRQAALEKYQLGESTIRRWIQVTTIILLKIDDTIGSIIE